MGLTQFFLVPLHSTDLFCLQCAVSVKHWAQLCAAKLRQPALPLLFVSLAVWLSISLSGCRSASLPLCLAVFLSFCPSVFFGVPLSCCLSASIQHTCSVAQKNMVNPVIGCGALVQESNGEVRSGCFSDLRFDFTEAVVQDCGGGSASRMWLWVKTNWDP